MPHYKLINGSLSRDGVQQNCPFSPRLLVPAPTTFTNALAINEKICGTWCPLFSVTEDEKGHTDEDVPSFATLHCAPKTRQFDVEIVTVKTDNGSLISKSN